MIRGHVAAIIDLFFPNYCLLDGKKIKNADNYPLCEACFEKIKFTPAFVCSKCGKALYKSEENKNKELLSFVCQQCARNKDRFRLARSACIYEGVIKNCVHSFKYKKKMSLRKLFAAFLSNAFDLHFAKENYNLILSVPMHPVKRFFREFNHAEILADDLSLHCGIRHFKKGLKRLKFTKSQTTLGASQRKKNVKESFGVPKPQQIQGKKILLIDDVATTLSTVNECATTLLSNGAKLVDVLTIARD